MNASGSARVITEALGGSALAVAVQGRRLPDAVQPWWPATLDEWREHAERVRGSAPAEWLEAIRPALAPSGEAATRLARVSGGRGIVVTTGQQAGVFGGPLYTLTKALGALGLADAIQERLGIPAAPVFWAATDDADFAEAATTYAADADGLHELTLGQRPPAGTPMADALLGADATALVDRLRRACGSAAHVEFFELARASFTEQHTLGDAYVRLLRSLLEPLGIAVMDSSHAAYRHAARPILRDALSAAPTIARATAEAAAAIRQAGFEPQVQDDRGLSLVFAIEQGLKRRVSVDDAGRVTASSDLVLAPNVLLRPVVERALFPTVAYVAGPGELAYFAQSNAAGHALGREGVVGTPRWSCTVVEPFADRALRRLGVAHGELADVHALERRLAVAAMPAEVSASWARLQEVLRAGLAEFAGAVNAAALLPPAVVQGLDRSLAHRLNRTERRLRAAVKRRDERTRRDLATASGALYPGGRRQERVLNYIPMLARGGDDLMDALRRGAHAHALALLAVELPQEAAR
ncbi:MAG: bacillithiol biosynthesis BshC [Gemmatimonadaceae bacterium]